MATKRLKDLSSPAQLILNTALEDPEHWDLADALLSEKRLRVLSQATPQDIDDVLAFIRTRLEKGVADAKEMLDG